VTSRASRTAAPFGRDGTCGPDPFVDVAVFADVDLVRLGGQKLCPSRFSVMTSSKEMAGCIST
jgi:hypothetical protein